MHDGRGHATRQPAQPRTIYGIHVKHGGGGGETAMDYNMRWEM